MNIVFTKKGLLGLSKSHKDDSFDEILNQMRKGMSLKLTFSKNDLKFLPGPSKNIILALLKKFTRNKGEKIENNSITWCYTPPKELYDKIFNQVSLEELFSVYILSNDKSINLVKTDKILCSVEGEELKTIKKLYISPYLECSYVYEIKKYLDSDWNIIKENRLPTTDIIITDGYLFGRGELFYEKNVLRILEILIGDNITAKKNIVLFTYKEVYDHISKKYYQTNANRIINLIKNLVKFEDYKPNVTVVLMPPKTKHERMIVTNYKTFISGDSFNYYDPEGKLITKDENFTIYNNTLPSYYDKTLSYLSRLQKIIQPTNTIGDAESNLLLFI